MPVNKAGCSHGFVATLSNYKYTSAPCFRLLTYQIVAMVFSLWLQITVLSWQVFLFLSADRCSSAHHSLAVLSCFHVRLSPIRFIDGKHHTGSRAPATSAADKSYRADQMVTRSFLICSLKSSWTSAFLVELQPLVMMDIFEVQKINLLSERRCCLLKIS